MSLSLYVHIPFCQRKCPYCDFNTYAGLNRWFEPYTAALAREIELAGAERGRPAVKTLFLGGGTPTVLPAELLAQIVDACRNAFNLLPDAEITSEANPGTVDVGRFIALRQLGVNRLSMGVQSFDPAELAFLGRIHSAAEAAEAMHAARDAGFDNINLDFIYGLPDQSPPTWRRTLEQAIALAPEHISLYSLTIEDGTPFGEWAAAGRLSQPSPDLAADLYEMADELLGSAGYVQYEISNWAKSGQCTNQPTTNPDFACRHNLTYWRNESYLGFGPGAHSSESDRRWAGVRPVPEYIEQINSQTAEANLPSLAVAGLPLLAVAGLRPSHAAPATAVAGLRPSHAPLPWVDFVEEIDDRLAMGETMMLGLRLVKEGVTFERFHQRHGRPMQNVFSTEIERLERLGLLDVLPDRVRLTQEARLVGNQVFGAFLP
jgi:oxygen-independent coproporphyrinogen-3 oxidase